MTKKYLLNKAIKNYLKTASVLVKYFDALPVKQFSQFLFFIFRIGIFFLPSFFFCFLVTKAALLKDNLGPYCSITNSTQKRLVSATSLLRTITREFLSASLFHYYLDLINIIIIILTSNNQRSIRNNIRNDDCTEFSRRSR